jgi:hypothetical protein
MDQSHAILLAMRALAFLLALSLTPAIADDGAASIAAGGLVMRREPRITMAREVLTISTSKVTVDYDFRNDTDADITTEVAFPIPPYSAEYEERDPAEQGFLTFKLWVNGQPKHFKTDLRAMLRGRDFTRLLQRYPIDIGTFGHETDPDKPTDYTLLAPAKKHELVALGLYGGGDPSPLWSVHKRYYWSQTFPAKSIVHIRHEYSPVVGGVQTTPDFIPPNSGAFEKDKYTSAYRNALPAICVSPPALSKLARSQGIILVSWVDFILTTANTWKRPIEDFTLIVERPAPKSTVSFCWDGPVEQLDANHFQAHATNLIPTKELHIGFYHLLPPEKP